MIMIARFAAAAAAFGASRLPPPRSPIRSRLTRSTYQQPYPQQYQQPYPAVPAAVLRATVTSRAMRRTRSGRDHRSAARQPLQCHRPPGGLAMRERGDDPGGAPVRQRQQQRLWRPHTRLQPRRFELRVTAITDVQRRNNGLRVTGTMGSGYGGLRRPVRLPEPRLRPAATLSFRCNVDYRGAVTNIRIGRNNGYRRYRSVKRGAAGIRLRQLSRTAPAARRTSKTVALCGLKPSGSPACSPRVGRSDAELVD